MPIFLPKSIIFPFIFGFFLPFSLEAQLRVDIRISQPTCAGYTNGVAFADASGGVAPYRFLWQNNSAGSALYGLSSGSVSVTVTDARGNTAENRADVAPPPPLSINADFGQFCTNRRITIVPSGSVPPYSFVWDDGYTGASRMQTRIGGHNITVTDARGCTQNTYVYAPPPMNLTVQATGQRCYGDTNAVLTANISGGLAPYRFLWHNGANTPTITGLGTSIYSLTVTDALGCNTVSSGQLSIPQNIVGQLVIDSTNCNINNGRAEMRITNGIAPFRFRWSNGANTAVNQNLAAGIYTLVTTDGVGCSRTDTVRIATRTDFTIAIQKTNTRCNANDGTAMAIVNSGRPPFRFRWSRGDTVQNISNLATGIYRVSVSDANQCENTAETVINAGSLSLSTTKTDASCNLNNGTATVTPLGRAPFRFLWSNTDTSQTTANLSNGNYQITVSDANNCISVAQINIVQTGMPHILPDSAHITCPNGRDGRINIAVSGGVQPYRFLWSNGMNTASLTNLPSNVYTVTVADAQNCQVTRSVSLREPPLPDIRKQVQGTTCNMTNGSAQINVQGSATPYRFRWGSGAVDSVVQNMASGVHYVTITDNNTCIFTDSVTVGASLGVSVVINVSNITCFGAHNGEARATVTSGFSPHSFRWSSGAVTPSVSNLDTGRYTLTVTDARLCGIEKTFDVVQPDSLSLTYTVRHTKCGENNGAILTQIQGGTPPYYFYVNNEPNPRSNLNLDSLAAGFYTIILKDAYNCEKIFTQTIFSSNSIRINLNSQNTECLTNTGSIAAVVSNAQPPYTYRWSNGATTPSVANLAAGYYSVTVSDANSCEKIASTQIRTNTQILLVFSKKNISCYGGNDGFALVRPTAGQAPYRYRWDNNSTDSIITNLRTGRYRVTVTDAAGCTASDFVEIEQSPLLDALFSTQAATCLPTGRISATVTGGTMPYTYYWSNRDTTPSVSNLATGSYRLTVTDAKNCRFLGSVFLDAQTSKPVCSVEIVKSASDDVLRDGQIRVVTTNIVAPMRYLWNTNDTTATVQNLPIGSYRVTVTDALGCTTSCQNVLHDSTHLYGKFWSFTVLPNPQNTASILTWETLREVRSSTYIVEWSADSLVFVELARFLSKNDERNIYTWIHTAPKKGRNYYRIRQMKQDLSVFESEKRLIVFRNSNNSDLLAYPNPTKNYLYIEVLDAVDTEGGAFIYNTLGELVAKYDFRANTTVLEIKTNDLQKGIYLVVLQYTDGNRKTVKFLKE